MGEHWKVFIVSVKQKQGDGIGRSVKKHGQEKQTYVLALGQDRNWERATGTWASKEADVWVLCEAHSRFLLWKSKLWKRCTVTDAYVSSTVLVWVIFELDKKFKYIYQVEKVGGIWPTYYKGIWKNMWNWEFACKGFKAYVL